MARRPVLAEGTSNGRMGERQKLERIGVVPVEPDILVSDLIGPTDPIKCVFDFPFGNIYSFFCGGFFKLAGKCSVPKLPASPGLPRGWFLMVAKSSHELRCTACSAARGLPD